MNYRREIDGLRAIAVLSVIFFHAGFEIFSGGFVRILKQRSDRKESVEQNNNYKLLCTDKTDKSCSARKLKLDEQQDRLHQIKSYYASSLVDAASLYGEMAIEKEVGVFSQMITINKKLSPLKPFLATHWDNQKSYLRDGKVNINGWLENCMKVESKQKTCTQPSLAGQS